MRRLLRFLTRPRTIRIPQFRLLPTRAVHIAVTTFWHRIAWHSRQLKYAAMVGLIGFTSWVSISYWLRRPVVLPRGTYGRQSRRGGRELYIRAEDSIPTLKPGPLSAVPDPIQDSSAAPASGKDNSTDSAMSHIVSIAFGAIGDRLLQLFGSVRAIAPPRASGVPSDGATQTVVGEAAGTCAVCFDQMPDMVLLTCRHLVLCEACYTQMQARAVRGVVECPVCRAVVAGTMKVFR